jgi:predicted nucleic acid-binding protein
VILVDSNVLIDVFDANQPWHHWSAGTLSITAAADGIGINAIIVAEVAPRMHSLAMFHDRIGRIGAEILDLTPEAAFAAGRAFDLYRARRREKSVKSGAVLPDFFIGGHATVLGASILTRDPRFYRSYFPELTLITPETQP